MSHFVQELQRLKSNVAETASLVVGSQDDKEALCRDTQQMMTYYEGIQKNLKARIAEFCRSVNNIRDGSFLPSVLGMLNSFFFRNSKIISKICILFELCLGLQ